MEKPVNHKITNKLSRVQIHKVLMVLSMIYFIAFGLMMVHTSGQPDQAPHTYFSRQFSQTWGIPEENPNLQYTITGQPYLYYWLNGAAYKIYRLLFPAGELYPALLWRLMSLFYSSLTVFFTYKLAKSITGNPYTGVISAFFLSNTLMFAFVSGGISYDNLIGLATAAAVYHLISLYKGKEFIRQTSLIGIWVIIGALAKDQFLLLTLIIFIAWLFYVIRHFRQIQLKLSKLNFILIIAFTGFLILFIELYGVNFIRYGQITPVCSQIKSLEVCRTYTYRFEYYEPFNLQWMWFVRDSLIDPIRYAGSFCIFRMIESIWGILSHNSFIPTLSISLHAAMIFWAFTCLIYYRQPRDSKTILLAMIILCYGTYVFLWNYKREVEYDFQHFVVTGRYLLPILSIFLVMMTHIFFNIKHVFLRKITIASALILYFSGGLGIYLNRYAEVFAHWRLYFH